MWRNRGRRPALREFVHRAQATPELPGPLRLALFWTWPPGLQARAWAELRQAVELDRDRGLSHEPA
jgi:hypothetical protein